MKHNFSDVLKKLRTAAGFSQQTLAEKMYVTRSTVARWENGSRQPDAVTLSRLAEVLDADVNVLLSAAGGDARPNVILVDDRPLILTGSLPVLEEVMPHANVTGFTDPRKAVAYAEENRVSLAFLDIELRNDSGLQLCRALLDVYPRTNVIYLTAYCDYALEAWSTGASGFMLKPITPQGVREQLKKLRYPFWTGGEA